MISAGVPQEHDGDAIHDGSVVRVMVVDDVDTVRSLLAELLAAAGGLSVCATASDGQEAITRALEVRPDVILMDLKMPKVDGLTALKVILASWPEAKIVMNSAFGDRALMEAALAAGARRFMTKDVRPRVLIDAILEIGRD